MTAHSKPRIVFAGVVRDCAQYLPAVLKGVDNLAAHFPDSAFIFVENDSRDASKSILNEWGATKSNFRLVNLDGLGAVPRRGLRLEIARATCIEFIRADTNLAAYDYLVVLDMDDVNVQGVNAEKFLEALDFLKQKDDHAAVFANQLGTYYDMWTIRHKDLCPGDLWEEVLDWAHSKNVSDEEAFQNTFAKRIISLPPDNAMLEVDSAFGGFGIYKISFVLRNPNPYLGSKMKLLKSHDNQLTLCRWEICEHVHFNAGIRSLGGRLFIKQDLINSTNSGLQFPPSAFRQFIF